MTIRALTTAAICLAAVAASPIEKSYEVKKGDTLTKISKTFGVSPKALAKSNGLANSHNLRPGQKLIVPSQASAPTQVTVVSGGVTLSADPRSTAIPVAALEGGAIATMVAESDGWSKLQLTDGTIGWSPSNKLLLTSGPFSAVTRVVKKVGKTTVAKVGFVASALLVKKAIAYRGVRYRYGGMSRAGVDCSGFTSTVYRSFGVRLPRTSILQSRAGTSVPKSGLKTGDLVFFRTNRGIRINHVGIYIGEDRFIHAASGHGRVRIDTLSDGYYKRRYATARRVAKVSPLKSDVLKQVAIVTAIDAA